MGKKCLRSKLSEEEAYLYTQGLPVIGTGNPVAELFRFVGRYEYLKEHNREEEIVHYRPVHDIFFKNENAGYTTIGKEIEKRTDQRISRKYLKSISRKWSPGSVKISFDTPVIISVLFSYIMERENLRTACVNHFVYKRNNWHNIMPIQFEFLGVRQNDHDTDWQKAEMIINDLNRRTLL